MYRLVVNPSAFPSASSVQSLGCVIPRACLDTCALKTMLGIAVPEMKPKERRKANVAMAAEEYEVSTNVCMTGRVLPMVNPRPAETMN